MAHEIRFALQWDWSCWRFWGLYRPQVPTYWLWSFELGPFGIARLKLS